MTTKHRRQLIAMFRPRRPRTITTYGVHQLDNSREEVMPSAIRRMADGSEIWLPTKSGGRKPMLPSHRDAVPDDPWLAPAKSETIKALEVHIATAQRQTFVNDTINVELDVREFCQDANLTTRQTEVICLIAEGWTQRAVASWLDISQPAVWKHLQHGRHKLAGQLPWLKAMRVMVA